MHHCMSCLPFPQSLITALSDVIFMINVDTKLCVAKERMPLSSKGYTGAWT